jgi:photosystem II stability/assembly factor-like uncharacterized protein
MINMKNGKWLIISILIFQLIGLRAFAQQTSAYKFKSVSIMGGGYVTGVVYSPIKKDLIYARTDMGGAYRWNVQDSSWVAITDMFSRLDWNWYGIESIAPDPVDTNTVYMAVGTYVATSGGCILKSTNRGETWTKISIPSYMGANDMGRGMGERLAIDPNNNQILYFASRTNGLLKSSNAGQSWSKVSDFPVSGMAGIGLSFVQFVKSTGQTGHATSRIYVGVASTASNSNLYCSSDTGKTWNLVTGGPSGLMPHRAAVASDSTIYLVYNNFTGPWVSGVTSATGKIWKLHFTNDQWTNISPANNDGGFGGITVCESTPKYIIATTLDNYGSPNIFRSYDGGTNWTSIYSESKANFNGAEYIKWGTTTTKPATGWMTDIEIDPFDPSRAMYVTGAGVWCSYNASSFNTSNVVWKFESKGIEESVALEMNSSVNGALLSALGDNCGMRHTNLDQSPSTGMFSPINKNVEGLDFAGLNPQVVARFCINYGGSLYALYSLDNGISWTQMNISKIIPSKNYNYSGSIAVSADGNTFILNQAANGIFLTNDKGKTWTKSTGLPNGAAVYSDRVNPYKFYSVYGSKLYVSEDGGHTFVAKASVSGGLKARPVFGRENDIWIPSSNGLFHTTDAGVNMQKIDNVGVAYAVGFGKAAVGSSYPSIYLIGNVKGVYGFYRSTDAGASWTRINDNAHQYGSVDHIAGDENIFGRVYLGTGGRGIVYGEPVYDCNGDSAGTAYVDACATCVGGNTGKTACSDCNGDVNGSAYTDECGNCVGGNTGKTPCVRDCNGDLGGSAYYDACATCVGGNTGKTACVPTSIINIESKGSTFTLGANPFSTSTILQVSMPSNYSITDVSGKYYQSGDCQNNCELGSALPSGVYVLTVVNKAESKSIKFVKK